MGKTLAWSVGALLATTILGWQTFTAEKGSFSNAMFTAAPLGLAAGIAGGFAHGAVRQSEVSNKVSDLVVDWEMKGLSEIADSWT